MIVGTHLGVVVGVRECVGVERGVFVNVGMVVGVLVAPRAGVVVNVFGGTIVSVVVG